MECRDKLENFWECVLRTSENLLKIPLFVCCRLSRVLMSGLTHVSTQTFGTLAYMPAELLKEGRLQPATDSYSFGMLSKHLTPDLPRAVSDPLFCPIYGPMFPLQD